MLTNVINSSKGWLGLLVQLFFLASTAVSCFFVGLFLYLGLELMVILDKQSLLEAIFFYAAVFSVVMAISTLITSPIPPSRTAPPANQEPTPPPQVAPKAPEPEPSIWTRAWRMLPGVSYTQKAITEAQHQIQEVKKSTEDLIVEWRQEVLAKLSRAVPALLLAMIAFVFWMLHLWRGVMFCLGALALYRLARKIPRLAYPLALVAFTALGALRADLINQLAPSLIVYGSTGKPDVEAAVILASSRGLLTLPAAKAKSERRARFLPWEHVASVEPNATSVSVLSRRSVCVWLVLPDWTVFSSHYVFSGLQFDCSAW